MSHLQLLRSNTLSCRYLPRAETVVHFVLLATGHLWGMGIQTCSGGRVRMQTAQCPSETGKCSALSMYYHTEKHAGSFEPGGGVCSTIITQQLNSA